MIDEMRTLGVAVWGRAVVYGAAAAVLIGVPSEVIDTPIFGRPIATSWLDYAILAVTASLIGLIFAIRPVPDGQTNARRQASESDPASESGPVGDASIAKAVERQGTATVWGGFVSFLAVGCPVCNQAIVALVGASGALSWWAPVQPVVGLVAIGLLTWTLRRRLGSYRLAACRIPA